MSVMPVTKKKVLVFEDNPNIQVLLRLFFEKRGCDPVVVGDGVDALAEVQAHAPALIMMDMIMPGKDGVAACRDLRAAGIEVPIVMLTSKDYADDRRRAASAGATAYLTKPFNPAQLQKVVEPFLR